MSSKPNRSDCGLLQGHPLPLTALWEPLVDFCGGGELNCLALGQPSASGRFPDDDGERLHTQGLYKNHVDRVAKDVWPAL